MGRDLHEPWIGTKICLRRPEQDLDKIRKLALVSRGKKEVQWLVRSTEIAKRADEFCHSVNIRPRTVADSTA